MLQGIAPVAVRGGVAAPVAPHGAAGAVAASGGGSASGLYDRTSTGGGAGGMALYDKYDKLALFVRSGTGAANVRVRSTGRAVLWARHHQP